MSPEGAREREVHRYYQPWLETFMSTAELEQIPQIPPPPEGHRPRSSSDKGLTAFAQLGCLRLNAKRGIVTLLDATRQYIIAEATKSLSLLSDSEYAAGDELWFGNSFIERDKGISADAMYPEPYTAHGGNGSSHTAPALVVQDIAAHDRFKSRGYAGDGVSFYCGVPITTKNGYVIGVYTVTDDKRRDGLSPDELRFMVDMSVIVAQHLESVKNDRARARGERLINWIGRFIEGDSGQENLPEGDSQSPPSPSKPSEAKNLPDGVPHSPSSSISKHPQFKGMVIGDANNRPRERESPANGEPEQLPNGEPDQLPKEESSDSIPNASDVPKPESQATAQQAVPTLEGGHPGAPRRMSEQQKVLLNSQSVFDRAATILRYCLNADGVVFLDASSANLDSGSSMKETKSGVTTFQHEKRKSRRQIDREKDISRLPNDSPREASADLDQHNASDGSSSTSTAHHSNDSSASQPKNRRCEVLAASMAGEHRAIKLPEQTLRRFVRRHPQGKCFMFDQNGKPMASDTNSESASTVPENASAVDGVQSAKARRHLPTTNALLKAVPGARNVVFVPLWDFAKERWHAGLLVWSDSLTRLTNVQDDMSYLKAFNNAVMNEINRINLAISDSAKSTFLANISHELRSPLHGILGSIEFLHDTAMDDFQASMVISVETCGKTLLDTVNHVLDYTKINNLSMRNGKSPMSNTSLTEDFDMACIVEEVVEAVYAGQVFRSANADALEGGGPSQSAAGRAMESRAGTRENIRQGSARNTDAVRLTLNIDDHTDWRVRSQPGAVRRVVMNILGNSLKYTSRGSIDVSLEVDGSRKKGHSNLHMLLKVTDTGQGMSDQFVKSHAFTAFSQEDSLASGTGLGLSIVRQIVDSLGGKIDLRSEKDVGTEVKIWLSLPKTSTDRGAAFDTDLVAEVRDKTEGLEMCLLAPADDRSDEQLPRNFATMPTVEGSMRRLTARWFRMNVSTATSMENTSPNFFLYPEPPPVDYLISRHGEAATPGEIPVIVLCTNAFEAASLRSHGIHRLTDVGRIIEVIPQPCGPQKLAKVLHRCMQRMSSLRDEKSKASSDPAPIYQSTKPDAVLAVRAPVDGKTRQGADGEKSPERSPTKTLTEGQGHLRRLSLPRRFVSENGGVHSNSADSAVDGEVKPRKPRVLVVDDNHINLHLLVTFVRKADHPYASAVDGLRALEAYRQSVLEDDGGNAFRYVLMDISMPVMNGIVAAREMREFEKRHRVDRPAQIIALTGLGNESAQSEAYRAGFDAFLSKPIKFKDLQKILV